MPLGQYRNKLEGEPRYEFHDERMLARLVDWEDDYAVLAESYGREFAEGLAWEASMVVTPEPSLWFEMHKRSHEARMQARRVKRVRRRAYQAPRVPRRSWPIASESPLVVPLEVLRSQQMPIAVSFLLPSGEIVRQCMRTRIPGTIYIKLDGEFPILDEYVRWARGGARVVFRLKDVGPGRATYEAVPRSVDA